MNPENAEKNLWDQIRSITQLLLRLLQGGVTTLVGLWTAIAFYRREQAESLHLVGMPLPFRNWVVGFSILVLVCTIFYLISHWLRTRLLFYIQALHELPDQYPDHNVRIYPRIPKDMTISYYTRLIWWLIPFGDVVLYVTKLLHMR